MKLSNNLTMITLTNGRWMYNGEPITNLPPDLQNAVVKLIKG